MSITCSLVKSSTISIFLSLAFLSLFYWGYNETHTSYRQEYLNFTKIIDYAVETKYCDTAQYKDLIFVVFTSYCTFCQSTHKIDCLSDYPPVHCINELNIILNDENIISYPSCFDNSTPYITDIAYHDGFHTIDKNLSFNGMLFLYTVIFSAVLMHISVCCYLYTVYYEAKIKSLIKDKFLIKDKSSAIKAITFVKA